MIINPKYNSKSLNYNNSLIIKNKNSFTSTKNLTLNSKNLQENNNSLKIAGGITFMTLALGFIDVLALKGNFIKKITFNKIGFIKTVSNDVENVIKNDAATKNKLEALLCTPGLHALWAHRIAHKLNNLNIPVLPRLISNISRTITGIEIHPGAKIGKNVFFDHTGAIVGETAEIGNNVTIIGRVCLGATGKERGARHTIVEDNVVIGMNSVMLGRIKLKKNSIIGAGSLITKDVPEGATVIGNPAFIIRLNEKKIEKPIKL
ncbi:MAG: serine O-acetyltransferase EpsC [bacterium]